jgi:hypothetical protein
MNAGSRPSTLHAGFQLTSISRMIEHQDAEEKARNLTSRTTEKFISEGESRPNEKKELQR